jgi:flagellar protein FlaJ
MLTKKGLLEDLVFLLTYMASIATANISRKKIFEMTSKIDGWYGSKTIKNIHKLTTIWNIEYSDACNKLVQRVKSKELKVLLERLSNAVIAGEKEDRFFEKEFKNYLIAYKNEYERNLELLKRWSDAYASLLVSLIFIAMVVILSVILYSVGNIFTILSAVSCLILMAASLGAFIIYYVSPRDLKDHSLPQGSTTQELLKTVSKISIGLSILTICLFANKISIGMLFMVISIILLPVGILSKKNDVEINEIDKSFSSFIKALTGISAETGISITSALEKVNKEIPGRLSIAITHLDSRLKLGLDASKSWYLFAQESGSEIVNRFVRIFIDAISLGGHPAKVGKLIDKFILQISLLRKKRSLSSASFVYLVLPLHTIMIGIMVFICSMMTTLSIKIAELSTTFKKGGTGEWESFQLQFFNLQDVSMEFLAGYTVIVSIILSFSNAMALKSACGGSKYKFFYYFSILLFISGALLSFIPAVTEKLLAL